MLFEEILKPVPAPDIARGQEQILDQPLGILQRVFRPEMGPGVVIAMLPGGVIHNIAALDVIPSEHQLLEKPAVQHRAVVQTARVDIDAQYPRSHDSFPFAESQISPPGDCPSFDTTAPYHIEDIIKEYIVESMC